MPNEKETIGFIGIGLMGKPMTLRLLQAGYKVTVWNRTLEKTDPVVACGAHRASSIADVANASDIIMLSLTDTNAVEDVVFRPSGIVEHGADGKLIIDLSSIEHEATRLFAKNIHDRCEMAWVDSPVSGGVIGTEQSTLVIMAGGTVSNIERAGPVLQPLSQRVTRMGNVGAGQVTKICNQMIVSCNAMVIAEMIALAKRSGVDAERIPEALSGGFADSKPLQILGPEMATETFEPIKWRVKTLLKDLNMAVNLSGKQGSPVPMSGLAAQLMQTHGNHGYLEMDPSTLVKLYFDD